MANNQYEYMTYGFEFNGQFPIDVLNQLGKDGWKIVYGNQDGAYKVILILMREKP